MDSTKPALDLGAIGARARRLREIYKITDYSECSYDELKLEAAAIAMELAEPLPDLVAEVRQLRGFVEKTAEIAAASADAANRAREEARLWKALAQARAEHSTADPVAARMALRAAGIDPDALHHGDP